MSTDLINGLFEFVAAGFSTLNCYRIYRDKKVAGFSIVPLVFFTLWGLWNLYFYPSNDLFYSFIGGILMFLVNAIYIGQIVYYKRLESIFVKK